MRKVHKKRNKGIIIIPVVVLLAIAVVVFFSLYQFAGGHLLAKNSLDDLRGKNISIEQ